MRTRISERNHFPAFSPYTEYKKLNILFCDKKAYRKEEKCYVYKNYSLKDLVECNFLQWHLRGTFTSLDEMLCSLQISENDFSDNTPKDVYLDYIQFLLNALEFLNITIGYSFFEKQGKIIYNTIRDNCFCLLEKLDAEAKALGVELCVVYKNDVAAAVSIQQPDLAPSVVEYLKIDNRDDLSRKGEILCTLAKLLEPHENKLIKKGFKSLCSDTTFLLNKAGIRHSLCQNKKIDSRFLKMDDSERIKWYDRAFKAFLACMAVLPYIDFKDEITDLQHN